ncbi:hypothetical protein DFP72DRAFT_848905 [Ephemerocybe angulata]|uniref:Uncharacterized protein n=1 Tax=Ephemerocybe angulata TaxID=980116 RepID=A0A8H6HUV2_9AGAR|nr:hypothetical protein DFP72DRAFT_848905 [Tulosesus angulatus]
MLNVSDADPGNGEYTKRNGAKCPKGRIKKREALHHSPNNSQVIRHVSHAGRRYVASAQFRSLRPPHHIPALTRLRRSPDDDMSSRRNFGFYGHLTIFQLCHSPDDDTSSRRVPTWHTRVSGRRYVVSTRHRLPKLTVKSPSPSTPVSNPPSLAGRRYVVSEPFQTSAYPSTTSSIPSTCHLIARGTPFCRLVSDFQGLQGSGFRASIHRVGAFSGVDRNGVDASRHFGAIFGHAGMLPRSQSLSTSRRCTEPTHNFEFATGVGVHASSLPPAPATGCLRVAVDVNVNSADVSPSLSIDRLKVPKMDPRSPVREDGAATYHMKSCTYNAKLKLAIQGIPGGFKGGEETAKGVTHVCCKPSVVQNVRECDIRQVGLVRIAKSRCERFRGSWQHWDDFNVSRVHPAKCEGRETEVEAIGPDSAIATPIQPERCERDLGDDLGNPIVFATSCILNFFVAGRSPSSSTAPCSTCKVLVVVADHDAEDSRDVVALCSLSSSAALSSTSTVPFDVDHDTGSCRLQNGVADIEPRVPSIRVGIAGAVRSMVKVGVGGTNQRARMGVGLERCRSVKASVTQTVACGCRRRSATSKGQGSGMVLARVLVGRSAKLECVVTPSSLGTWVGVYGLGNLYAFCGRLWMRPGSHDPTSLAHTCGARVLDAKQARVLILELAPDAGIDGDAVHRLLRR